MDHAYTADEILQTECDILNTLEFQLTGEDKREGAQDRHSMIAQYFIFPFTRYLIHFHPENNSIEFQVQISPSPIFPPVSGVAIHGALRDLV
jgi:hypothetical protein